MEFKTNISLKSYSTMRLGGSARYLIEVTSVDDLIKAQTQANIQKLQTVVIGAGSNIIWQDGKFNGLVIVNKIKKWQVQKIAKTNSALFTFGAGENWDEMVKKTVEMNYSGLENLSFIPGTAGAAPVQNIGAYGVELSDTLVSVTAYDKQTNNIVTLTKAQCQFGYRDSCFKSAQKNRYIILSITCQLSNKQQKPPFYNDLQNYLNEHNITNYTPQNIRQAIITIRTNKLPNPIKIANSGSFFANPIISHQKAAKLLKEYPTAPNWETNNKIKLSAAWLIEQAGFSKGYQDSQTGMALWKNQALVLVNNNAKSTTDLLIFKKKIVDAVNNKFNIILQQEPELI